jgi:arylsulfatase A-like enzyme
MARRRLNVVCILADDLGWGDLGCYGHPKFRTPNIDRVAAEGVRLTDFYSTAPYCAPSRASLLTGRYPFRCGLTGNPLPLADPAGTERQDALGLPPEEVTLAEVFRAAGYRTGCIGKWHLGHRPQFRPRRQGFDEYLGILYSNDMHPVELWDGDRVVEYPVVQATLTRRYTERALRFLEKNRDRPFFLYFPEAMPHKPLAASEAFYKKSGAGLYGDAVAELDWSVGQVLAKLKELDLERDTLVVFASDNGPWYGGSTGGLRGMKAQTWEGGIRVPLIARWPARIPAGRVSHAPGMLADLFSTVLAAAGLKEPSGRVIDGRDLMPVFTSDAPSPHEAILSMNGDALATVRSDRWKLHLVRPSPARERVWQPGEAYTDPRGPDGVRILAPYEQAHPSAFPGVRTGDPAGPMSLFDLEIDSSEQHNVAKDHPDVVQRLRDLARGLRGQAGSRIPRSEGYGGVGVWVRGRKVDCCRARRGEAEGSGFGVQTFGGGGGCGRDFGDTRWPSLFR